MKNRMRIRKNKYKSEDKEDKDQGAKQKGELDEKVGDGKERKITVAISSKMGKNMRSQKKGKER